MVAVEVVFKFTKDFRVEVLAPADEDGAPDWKDAQTKARAGAAAAFKALVLKMDEKEIDDHLVPVVVHSRR